MGVALAGICSLRHGRTNEMQAGSRRLWGLSKGTDETQAENRRLWGASGVFGVGAGFFIGSDGEQAPEDFSFKMFVYNDNEKKKLIDTTTMYVDTDGASAGWAGF